ncbi:MAG: phospho-N-acetylmuramoyl-pentapeptide-transferase [Brevinema sp.]
MLFYLFSGYINIIRYLTFRGLAAALTSFLFVIIFGPFFIKWLREMRFGQQVREEGPQAHLAKTGTPTMGGLFMWGAMLFGTLLWAEWNSFVLITCLSVILFAGIGFIDDYAKIKQKNTKGLSPKGKIFAQTFSALLLLGLLYTNPEYHKTSRNMQIEIGNNQNNTIITNQLNLMEPTWEWTMPLPSAESNQRYYIIAKHLHPDTSKTNAMSVFRFPMDLSPTDDLQRISYSLISNNTHQLWGKLTRSQVLQDGSLLSQEEYPFWVNYKSRLFTAQFIPYYTEVLWYWPLALVLLFFIFIIIGVSNATNLSDGLDGLATGMGVSFYVPFGILAYIIGNAVLSNYLFFPYIQGTGELAICIAAAVGAFAGFLWYNVHPASIFMGDTGSLPMGSTIAIIAIMLRQEILLVVAGFMFVLETLSVIIQVLSYKKFKKRVFKMAPIHHHFELSGWEENQVVVRFWMMSAVCAMIALLSIKVR